MFPLLEDIKFYFAQFYVSILPINRIAGLYNMTDRNIGPIK